MTGKLDLLSTSRTYFVEFEVAHGLSYTQVHRMISYGLVELRFAHIQFAEGLDRETAVRAFRVLEQIRTAS